MSFIRKLSASDTMPHTSQPSPHDFVEVYKQIATPEDIIFSIHISSKLSGTCQSVYMAKELLPGYQIEVVDSKMTSMALGIPVIEAARAVNAGARAEEVREIIDYYVSNTKVFFAVETLEYLQKNGRIGKAKTLLGNLLNVKPILSLDQEGVIIPKEQVRGRKKAMEAIVALAEGTIRQRDNIIGCVIHAVSPADAEKVKERVLSSFKFRDLYISTIGSVIGTHAGPGLLGFAFAPAKE